MSPRDVTVGGVLGVVLGSILGFMLGGPIGILLGAFAGAYLGGVYGHLLISALTDSAAAIGNPRQNRAQLAFLNATFGVMSHVAQTNGRVSLDAIQLCRHTMNVLNLNAKQRRIAHRFFKEGKKPNFSLNAVLEQLHTECKDQPDLLRRFLEIQFQAAWIDGALDDVANGTLYDDMDAEKRRLLHRIADHLHFPHQEVAEIERLIAADLRTPHPPDDPALQDAYATLNVSPDAPDDEVRRAYRLLMNRHHPDKLQASEPPEQTMQDATERTQQIQAAWNQIQEARDARQPR